MNTEQVGVMPMARRHCDNIGLKQEKVPRMAEDSYHLPSGCHL